MLHFPCADFAERHKVQAELNSSYPVQAHAMSAEGGNPQLVAFEGLVGWVRGVIVKS